MPRAEFSGDAVTVRNVRNCRYLSADDYVVNFEDRDYDLAKLQTVDFIVCPFASAPNLAHTMLSFGFDDGEFLTVSVEARLEKGETYSPIRGALRQFELMYVVGDERDLVQLRTNYRKTDVYIYRANVEPDKVRALFVDMLGRANDLAERPEFYDTITNNCTSNIVSHVNRIKPGLIPQDIRVLLPGNSDQLAYELGLFDKSVPFSEEKRRAYVTDKAQQFADARDFSDKIRR